MSRPQIPPPARLFVSALFRAADGREDSPEWTDALGRLEAEFGPVDIAGPVMEFGYTDYYRREMGDGLRRRMLMFRRWTPHDALAEAKLFCLELERLHADGNGCRRVNLDPGLLSPENLVLATGKRNAHRIYLGHGICADLTLIYQNHRFTPLPWTYPDYASEPVLQILASMRGALLAARREEARLPGGSLSETAA